MGFLKRLFGNNNTTPPATLTPAKPKVTPKPPSNVSVVPSGITEKEFGKITLTQEGDTVNVHYTLLMEPQGVEAEGWQTGVALDGSGSMRDTYGRGIEVIPGRDIPDRVFQNYQTQGWLTFVKHQGQQYPMLNDNAHADLVKQGYARWKDNIIEPLARKTTAYLADQLDADGGTTVIYWACGNGREIEVIGDLSAGQCETARFAGPTNTTFGEGTFLAPAVKYFVERFADARNGMYLFITDGQLNDLAAVKQYTIELCRAIEAKRCNPIKCVLIGIGDDIDESQMEELDNLDSGTSIDIWDHKIAADMRSLVDIFAEVVNENLMVAPNGRIYDAAGTIVKHYTDGLTAHGEFAMAANSPYFELEVMGRRIRQPIR